MTTHTIESLRMAKVTAGEVYDNALRDTKHLMRQRGSSVSPEHATTYAAANNLQFDCCGNLVSTGVEAYESHAELMAHRDALLEACKVAERVLAMGPYGADTQADREKARDIIRAAIAKAKGGAA